MWGCVHVVSDTKGSSEINGIGILTQTQLFKAHEA